MRNYIIKPSTIKKSYFFERKNSFSPSKYQQVKILNTNINTLDELIEISTESLNLSNQKKYYQYIEIGDINTSTGGINYKRVKSIDISSNVVSKIKKSDILISTVRTYLGGIGLVTSSDNNLVATKALIVLRELQKDISKYYLFAILRSSFFIQQVSMILNASMYPRMEKDYFSDLKIPFPTKNQNQNPKNIEFLVSSLIQNVIDKEEQIKIKSKMIDEEIEKELLENQVENIYQYSYPKISELKRKGRLDTGLYKDEYKKNINILMKYKYSYQFLKELKYSWISGSTPKNYIKSDENNYLWIAVADINYGLTYNKLNYIKFKKSNIGLLKDGTILITRKGATVGKMNMFFKDKIEKAFVNEDIKVLNLKGSLEEKVFIGLFLNSQYGQIQLLSNGSKGTKQGLTNDNILNVIVPLFSKEKQKKISKQYYNKINICNDILLDTYLEKNKKRNQLLGIFQLNMEIFELKNQLDEIIDKIVMDEKIEIERYL